MLPVARHLARGESLPPACFLHDLKYWAGYPGEDVARLIADAELMIDVVRLLEDTVMAEIMFRGVRVGGRGLQALLLLGIRPSLIIAMKFPIYEPVKSL